MVHSHVILQAEAERYRPLYWQGQPVYLTHPRLQVYLSVHLGEDYALLLSSVRSQKNTLLWYSEKKLNQAISLSELPSERQEILKNTLRAYVSNVLGFSDILVSSNDKEENRWGELLRLAFTVPDYDHVFVDGERLVFAAWGFELVNPIKGGPISKDMLLEGSKPVKQIWPPEKKDEQLLPSTAEPFGKDDITESSKNSNKTKQESEESNDALPNEEYIQETPPGISNSDHSDALPEIVDDASSSISRLTERENPVMDDDKQNLLEPSTDKGSDKLNSGNEKKETLSDADEGSDIDTGISLRPGKNTEKEGGPQHSNTSKFNTPDSNSDPAESNPLSGNQESKNRKNKRPPSPPSPVSVWHWQSPGCIYRLLVLLILVVLVIIILRACNHWPGAAHDMPLPPRYGEIVPIKPEELISDPDSIKTIVANRLNVALIGENKDIPSFAMAFKNVYPDEAFRIIYYDTLTYRLQIQIPDTLRDLLIEELPRKLPQFKMLVWHESLFEHYRFPEDPGFNSPQSNWYYKVIGAENAWRVTYGKPEIVIAVVDDGFDLKHSEFAGKIYKPWNVCEHTTNVLTNTDAFHGTHVAGIATALRDNKTGGAGIAPDCKLMPIQVADRNGFISSTAVIDAILYAIHQGAKVINLSLGLKVHDSVKNIPLNEQQNIIAHSLKAEEAFWEHIFQLADQKNVTLVLAAGNQDILVGLDPMQRHPSGIKVNAVDKQSAKADFSNFGSLSTISAPGIGIYSAIPNNQYAPLDGTSMAAPIVTGAVALIKSINPNITTKQIIELFQKTGAPVYSPSKYVGKLLQLDKALAQLNANKNNPNDNCLDIRVKIDSLQKEIDRLKSLCPENEEPLDTMKMPKDLNMNKGRWRSTSYLYNDSGGQVTIYFDFNADGSNAITLVEPDGTACSANLGVRMANSILYIDQNRQAICNPPPKEYNPYSFSCRPDKNGYAFCEAQNQRVKANHFQFRLVKIK